GKRSAPSAETGALPSEPRPPRAVPHPIIHGPGGAAPPVATAGSADSAVAPAPPPSPTPACSLFTHQAGPPFVIKGNPPGVSPTPHAHVGLKLSPRVVASRPGRVEGRRVVERARSPFVLGATIPTWCVWFDGVAHPAKGVRAV